MAVLLDGYDEYKKGTNKEIDEAIESGIGNCFLLLTSRPGYVAKSVRDRMDGEVRIEGFNNENIRKCCDLYLGSKQRTDKLLQLAKKAGISEANLLRVPIILLMIIVIFDKKQSLPKTKTEIIRTIIQLMICVIFDEKQSLPKTKTEIIRTIIQLMICVIFDEKQSLPKTKTEIIRNITLCTERPHAGS